MGCRRSDAGSILPRYRFTTGAYCASSASSRNEWKSPLWTVKYMCFPTPASTCLNRAIANGQEDLATAICALLEMQLAEGDKYGDCGIRAALNSAPTDDED